MGSVYRMMEIKYNLHLEDINSPDHDEFLKKQDEENKIREMKIREQNKELDDMAMQVKINNENVKKKEKYDARFDYSIDLDMKEDELNELLIDLQLQTQQLDIDHDSDIEELIDLEDVKVSDIEDYDSDTDIRDEINESDDESFDF